MCIDYVSMPEPYRPTMLYMKYDQLIWLMESSTSNLVIIVI